MSWYDRRSVVVVPFYLSIKNVFPRSTRKKECRDCTFAIGKTQSKL